MKKTFLKAMLLVCVLATLLLFGSATASAVNTAYCTGKTVYVNTYEDLKDALQNYGAGQNVVFNNNIDITDDRNDLSINIKNSGALALDLNGYTLTVNSSATKYLFNVTGQSKLYFVNGNRNVQSAVYFNTIKPSAALVRADNVFCEINNINLKFIVGDNSAYKAASDSSDTAVFSVNYATELNIYGGTLINRMTNGCGIVVASNSDNARYLSFRVGGQAKIQAVKYCVNFDPAYVMNENFGSLRFESLNSNSSLYERIKVPSGSTLTAQTLWYTPSAGSDTAIYVGSILPINKDKKITDFKKADIRADKVCETLNNTEYFMPLYYSGGHVQLCGTCLMAYNGIEEHTKKNEIGTPATCTTSGMTSGYVCTVCYYSSRSFIPATGHLMQHINKKSPSCGVDGIKEHYYCVNCRAYFYDADGKKTAQYNDLVIPHNHRIKTYDYVAPTCTTDGLTEGSVCLTCGRLIQSQQKIPRLDHSYPSYWSLVSLPTCEKEGVRKKVCANCGNEIFSTMPKAEHSYNENGKCTECGKLESEPEPEKPEIPGTDNGSVNCKCGCHKKGILKFFFNIGLFFQKIFKANQICKGCGIAHY